MRKILILVLSADVVPYDKMITTSMNTWDSIDCEGTETIYYCGESNKDNTDKIIYLPVNESLHTMGKKLLLAFEWALKNKEFDYIARVHSSTYVNKKELFNYVQNLETENVFAGAEATSQNGFQYLWGGGHYVISKDVVKKIVDNKDRWNHLWMEDESMSVLVSSLGIPFTAGKSGSIDKLENGWHCISYGGGESISFYQFSDLQRLKHHFYRVKHDKDRSVDEYVMNELFKALNTK